jgi:hypothetical protein
MPWLVGGALLLGLVALSSSASVASGAQANMYFTRGIWHTQMPTTEVALWPQLPPPPGQSFAWGRWVRYPGGLDTTTTVNFPVSFYPRVPAGNDLYVWAPLSQTTPIQINGLWVISAPTDFLAKANGFVTQIWLSNGPGSIPPPPGQTQSQTPGPTSGFWRAEHPHYAVWLNTAAQAELAAPDVTTTAPMLASGEGAPALGAGYTLPAVSPTPIATT